MNSATIKNRLNGGFYYESLSVRINRMYVYNVCVYNTRVAMWTMQEEEGSDTDIFVLNSCHVMVELEWVKSSYHCDHQGLMAHLHFLYVIERSLIPFFFLKYYF